MTGVTAALRRREYELAALRTVLGALLALSEAVPEARDAFEVLLAESIARGPRTDTQPAGARATKERP